MERAIQVEKQASWVQDVLLIALWSAGIGASMQLAIPLPFTPVPIVLRSLFVLLAGALLGPKRGSLAVVGFLAQGVCGLPVFSGPISSGALALAGPLGGYFLGYIPAAYLTGWLVQRAKRARALFGAFAAGTSAIYLFGGAWLSLFVGLGSVFSLGVAPFLLGDALKILAAVSLCRWLTRTGR